MSDLKHASEVMADARHLADAASAEVRAAYQAVFDGAPTRDDQVRVLRDLADFCGMGTDLFHGSDRETANAVGKFRVWQRIHAYRFPSEGRPADARTEGENRGQSEPDNRPTHGGGVAEPTDD